MKKSIALIGFMIAMMFAMGGNITLTSNTDHKQTIGMEFFETAYAQDEAKPSAEAVKAAASATVEDAAKVEKKVPVLDGAKADQAEAPLATEDFLKALMDSVGGMKGLGSMGLVALIIQLMMLFFRTKLATFAGKWKLMIVYGLSMVGGILAMKVNGADWGAALVHANTLAAGQSWVHQLWKQFVEKKDEKKA